MMTNVYEPENPIVILSKDYYMELKRKAQLNDTELKKQATKMANEIMIKDGIDFTIRINGVQKILRYHEAVEIEEDDYNSWASWDPKIKKMKYSIANDLIQEINKAFSPPKEEIIKFVHEYGQEKKRHKKAIIKLGLYTLLLGITFLVTLIYAITK